VKCWSLLQI
jgi:hypothetical protein